MQNRIFLIFKVVITWGQEHLYIGCLPLFYERIGGGIIKKRIFVIKVLRYVAIILSLLLAIIIVIKK